MVTPSTIPLSTPHAAAGCDDPLYEQAVQIVLKNRKASIRLLQLHLWIGYNKAIRLLDAMEKAGLVSSVNALGQREILCQQAPKA